MGGDGVQMARFFIKQEDIDSDYINVSGDDFKHIKNVLRLRIGENITLCDGQKTDYNCVIHSFDDNRVTAEIIDKRENPGEPDFDVVLFQGIAKGDKMDLIIQKCVELGVSSVVPMLTERTVVNFKSQNDKDNKRKRWQKIAEEAAKQSERGIVPDIKEIVKPHEISLKEFDLIIIPYEEEMEVSLKSVLSVIQKDKRPSKIAVFIGPEGGFEKKEMILVRNSGGISVTLGPRILRTETAGLTVISILMYEFSAMER